MRRVGILPSLVTLANGYCGVLAIYYTHDGRYYAASLLILLAMVFDVFDGMIARRTGVTSSFGAYLDSLSDAISFGVAPAFLVKAVVEDTWPGLYSPKLLALLTALFALGALLRLARYNVEHASGEGSDREGREVNRFDGIPTPGAAGVLASFVFLAYDEKRLVDYKHILLLLPWVAVILAALMVSRVPYVHFGRRFLKVRGDFGYLFLVVALLVLITRFPEEFIAIGFSLYALSGPALAPFRKKRVEEEEPEPAIPDGL
ncbi:MAG: CDP-diacylglycerol--serine O-phosphatidyltransferase [Planctomycetota bacterium]|jgi:CDP-diacylglycerol--serine O-phosphatidyltransferase